MAQSILNNLKFRQAKRDECRTIATLYSISSDGVADYIWSGMAQEGEDILDVGQKRYEQEGSEFSYRNCTVVTIDENIAGMIVAFPMNTDPSANFSGVDPVLIPYRKLEEDGSYYVCGLSLFEQYRGRGIGRALMQLAEEKAKEKGINKISLIVFEQNKLAKSFYDRLGYKEVAREKVVPHRLISHTGDAVLMIKSI